MTITITNRTRQWHKKQQNKVKKIKIFKKTHNLKMMITKTKQINKIQTSHEKNRKRKKKARNNSKTISK